MNILEKTFAKWCLNSFFNTTKENILSLFKTGDVYIALEKAFKRLEQEDGLLFDHYVVEAITHRRKYFEKEDLNSKLIEIFGPNMIPNQKDLFELLFDLWRARKNEIPEHARSKILRLSEAEISNIIGKISRYFHEELSTIEKYCRRTTIARSEILERALFNTHDTDLPWENKEKKLTRTIAKLMESQENISLQCYYNEANLTPAEIIPIHLLSEMLKKMMYAKDWRNKIKEKLDKMKSRLYRLLPHEEAILITDEIKTIDFTLECTKVAALVKAFISSNSARILKSLEVLPYNEFMKTESNTPYEINTLKKILFEIEKDVNKPYFDKNLKIMGGLGAGKTLFLANLMTPNHFSDQDCIFLFFPIKFKKNESFGTLLGQYIDEATELKWGGFEKLYRFLATAFSKSESLNGTQNIKHIIVIDDIHQWIQHDNSITAELNELMFKYSKYTNVFWIFTLKSSNYDTVSSNNNYFEKYGPAMNIDQEDPLLNVAGWIDLDDINYRNNTGIEIISSKIHDILENDDGFMLEKYDSNEKLLRMISNPSIATILTELSKSIPLKEIVNLNYINFIEGFWENRLSILHNEKLRKYARFFVNEMSRILSKSFYENMHFTSVVDVIETQSTKNTELQIRENVLKAFESLQFLELLSRSSTDHKGSDDIIELEKLPFWYFHIASNLFSDLCESTNTASSFNEELSKTLSEAHNFNHLENIFDFYYSMINEDSITNSKRVKSIWYDGIKNNLIPDSSIWFAATKSTSYMQRVLLNKTKFDTYKPIEKRNLFSFMYFIALSDSHQIYLPNKFTALRPSLNRIKALSFESYYYYITEKTLSRVNDNDTLIECLAAMAGCEILQFTEQIASLSYRVLKRINDGNIKKIGQAIVKYLRDHCRNAEGMYINSVWKRYYLREFLVREYCKDLVISNNMDAYYLLKDMGWFKPTTLRIENPRIRLELEQEATIEIGSLYRRLHNREDLEEYHTFLYTLSRLADKSDSIRVVFIITHTVTVDNKYTVKISPDLVKIAEHAISKGKILNFVKNNQPLMKFIKHNNIIIE